MSAIAETDRRARVRRHPTHPADPCARAHGAIRVPLVSQRGGRTRMAGGHPGKSAVGRGDAGFGRQGESLGDRGLHLERVAGTRRGRGFAGHVSRRVQARNGRPRRDARRHRGKSPGPLGRRIGQPGLARDRDPVRPRRSGTSTVAGGTRKTRRAVRGRRSALVAGPGGDAAVRSCPRSLRLSRPALAAGHRRERRRTDPRLRPAAQAR